LGADEEDIAADNEGLAGVMGAQRGTMRAWALIMGFGADGESSATGEEGTRADGEGFFGDNGALGAVGVVSGADDEGFGRMVRVWGGK
jgi:hypothetical protein